LSVGHVSREFEKVGIPTVIIMSNVFRGRTLAMNPARVLFTPHLMGRPVSAPFDTERQRHVVREGLRLLETAEKPGTTLLLPEPYRATPA
jgi:hypothetical protein